MRAIKQGNSLTPEVVHHWMFSKTGQLFLWDNLRIPDLGRGLD